MFRIIYTDWLTFEPCHRDFADRATAERFRTDLVWAHQDSRPSAPQAL
jgi:hypothetical protein